MNNALSGLYAALATPYTDTDEISAECLKSLAHFVVRQKVDGIYVGGSTGEALLQSIGEREYVLEVVAEACRSNAKLIGHVGALSTNDSVSLAKTCARLKYDAVSAIPPIYFPYSKGDILGYYQAIIEAASGIPVIVYNIPAMSGKKFSLPDLMELLALPGVIGVKQTEIDMYQMEQLRRRYPELLLLNGYDEVFLSGLVSGADGGVGSTYNIMGWRYRKLWDLIETGQNKAALQMQSKCNEVIDLLVRDGVFPALKFILYKMGVIRTPHCRRPLGKVKDCNQVELSRVADTLIAELKNFELTCTK